MSRREIVLSSLLALAMIGMVVWTYVIAVREEWN